jgi:hypothetical protein
MGLIKKIFRPVRKPAKKIIPKEIKPALPFLAAYFGPATLAKEGIFSNKILTDALLAAGTAAATDEDADLLRTAALAAAPEALSQGLGAVSQKFGPTQAVDFADELTFAQKIGAGAQKGQAAIEGAGLLKTVGAQTALDQSARLAEIRQKELDEYNRNLREQGVLDKTKRRTAIFNIYKNAGYEDDYVNSMLDRYGYDEGGLVEALKAIRAKMKAPETIAKQMSGNLRRKPKDDDIMIPPEKPKDPKDKNEDEPVEVSVVKEKPDFVEAMLAAKSGVEQAFGIPFGGVAPAEFKRFARGGEVEIEEETEDLDILDFMKDQGVPFGEMASDINNERILEQLYEGFLDMGMSPEDAAKAARETFDRMSKRSGEGIMQMAKSDIEDMYEQYVFEMEEMGVTPMSFSEFVAREKAGMKDGGKVRRRKKGEPMDDDDKKPGPSLFPKVPKGNFFLDKMPKPKRREGILEVANGGEVLDPQNLPFPFFMEGGRPTGTKPGLDYYDQDEGSKGMMRKRKKKKREEKADGGILKAANGGTPGARYSFLINKQKQGILSPDEEEELLMLEMTFADESQGKADGGIMEKDMRGGGFIPEGSKERADDVPARLSKNEFVMTADAVRAAGGGSVNKGAKRMYDMMYSLEGKI